MKRNFYALGLMLAAAFTLTNCAQEIANPNEQPETAGYPFEIVASTVDTKTVNDGMATKWAEGDQINLFHAVGETTEYVNDKAFSLKDLEEGKFEGKLDAELDYQEEYDWYALYPYNDKIETPGDKTVGFTYIGYSSELIQKGYNSMASLKGSVCPLYGVAKAVPADETPDLTMEHLSSVVAIKVTNANVEPLTVTTASFTATEDIVGSYFIDITKTPVVYKASGPDYVKNTATVTVTSGATSLAKDESATLYLAIKPFKAALGKKLTLSVNGYSKEITLTKDVTFSAGKIKTLNFSYDKPAVVVGNDTDILTRETTGISNGNTTYQEWEGKTSNTSAVYAGQSAGNYNSIQLRSSNNNSGIVTTSSGGYAKKISVTYNSNTASGRTLNVYGRNTPYTSPEDLYSPSTQGTLLGTIVYGTSTDLDIDGNYEYIGMRSASGAMYVSEIQIKWSNEAADVAPLESISVSGQTTKFLQGEGFVFDGVVTATYTDGTKKQVVPTSVSNPEMTSVGDKIVTVTYTEGTVTKTCEYTITVTAPTESWTKINSLNEIVTGEYVIVVKTKTKIGFLPSTATSSAPAFNQNITISGNTIAKVDDNMKFTFTVNVVNGKPHAVITNASGKILYITNDNNGVKIGDKSIEWAIDNHDTGGTFKFTTTTVSRFLGVYNEQDWRCYTTYNASNFKADKGSSAIYLYKKN